MFSRFCYLLLQYQQCMPTVSPSLQPSLQLQSQLVWLTCMQAPCIKHVLKSTQLPTCMRASRSLVKCRACRAASSACSRPALSSNCCRQALTVSGCMLGLSAASSARCTSTACSACSHSCTATVQETYVDARQQHMSRQGPPLPAGPLRQAGLSIAAPALPVRLQLLLHSTHRTCASG